MWCFVFTFINLIFFPVCGSRCPGHLSSVSSHLLCLRQTSWFPPSPGQRLQGHVLSAKGLRGSPTPSFLNMLFPCSLPSLFPLGLPTTHYIITIYNPGCCHHWMSLHFHSYIKKKKEKLAVPKSGSSFLGSQSQPHCSMGLRLLGEEQELLLFIHLFIHLFFSIGIYWMPIMCQALVLSVLCENRHVAWSHYIDPNEKWKLSGMQQRRALIQGQIGSFFLNVMEFRQP